MQVWMYLIVMTAPESYKPIINSINDLPWIPGNAEQSSQNNKKLSADRHLLKPLTLKGLSGAFVVLGVGYSIAIAAFIVELVHGYMLVYYFVCWCSLQQQQAHMLVHGCPYSGVMNDDGGGDELFYSWIQQHRIKESTYTARYCCCLLMMTWIKYEVHQQNSQYVAACVHRHYLYIICWIILHCDK